MLHPTKELAALDRRHAEKVLGRLTYGEALAQFTALWEHARKLNADFPAAWHGDIDADLELARVLNGLAAGA